MDQMPRIGAGTWQITGRRAREAVRDALGVGYRHIDTARAYDNEREVAAGIADAAVPREELWLTTKVWLDDLTAARLRSSAEASLRDLAVDYVDLLLIHWPSHDVAVSESLGEMRRLQAEGKTRRIGVSNFPPGLLREALQYAPLYTDQVELHPFLAQDELLEIAEANDMVITAYAPLGHGKAVTDPTITEVAERLGRTPAQVILRWLLDLGPVAVLPKASSRERLESNFDLEFELPDEDRARIDALPKDRREFDPAWGPDWSH